MRRQLITLLAGTALAACAVPADAQSLAARIDRAPADASVRFSFDSKPGVCGDGESISVRRDGETVMSHGRSYRTENGRYVSSDRPCEEGPVRVELTRSAGAITDARIRVGGTPRSVDVDLGTVPAEAAVEYMLDENTLRRVPARRGADQFVFAVTLSEAEAWPDLLRIARDQQMPEGVRTSAIFWVAQVAGERATEGLTSVIGDNSDELEIRKQAIFALSQIREASSVDALIEVARTSREPEIRKSAIFWLGQSKDPRVLAFFEQVLRG
jgi:hypothetical protein